MSEFVEIVNYLKIARRSDEQEAKNKFLTALIIDENYIVDRKILHEEDLIFIEKEALVNSSGYKNLEGQVFDELYCQCVNGELIYYVDNDRIRVNDEPILYIKLPLHPSHVWEELDENSLVSIKLNDARNLYYDFVYKRVIEVFLENIFPIVNKFVYHPKDIKNISDGKYLFNFEDIEGYTADYLDLYLRTLLESSPYKKITNISDRIVNFSKAVNPGLAWILPKVFFSGSEYVLSYKYFQKGVAFNGILSDDYITIKFKKFGAMAEFLNQTIFYRLDSFENFEMPVREHFLDMYSKMILSEFAYANSTKKLEILYFIPIFLFKKIDRNLLWDILNSLLNDSVTNIGINKEDIVVRIIEGLSETYENKNIFLAELINRKTKNKEQFIKRLFYRIDGENYKNLLNFLWDIWKKSTYAELTPEKNHLINFTDKNPLLLDYRSKKSLGFHIDNAKINWDKNDEIEVTLTVGTGVFETNTEDNGRGGVTTETTEIKETFEYSYHPFAPIAILNADNPTFIYKDPEQKENNFTKLPAFLLHTHTEKAFWENVMTTGEYTVDVLTTISGFGNICKAGRLFKVLEAGNSLTKRTRLFTKVVTGVKGVAGVAEISSGSVNVLLKLIGGDDTELGREISKYLFYFEMMALSGELSATLYSKLQTCATRIIAKEKVLKEAAENFDETRQIELLLKELRVIANQTEKIVYEPLIFNKLYSFSAAALDGALNVSKNIFFYLKNLIKTNTETVFYKGVEIFTDSPANVKLFLEDAAKVLKAKGVKGVEDFFEATGSSLIKKRLHSQTGETFICDLIRKKEMNKYYYEIENFQYGTKSWNRKADLRNQRFECFVTLANKPEVAETIGKNILYADLYVPKVLNDTFQANKLDLTDISLGKTMLDDGYAVLKKDLGKDLDGIYAEWLKSSAYKDFGGESVNLTKLKEAMNGKAITKENLEKAAMATVTGKWAASKGFTKAMVVSKSEIYEFLDNNINLLEQLEVIFIK